MYSLVLPSYTFPRRGLRYHVLAPLGAHDGFTMRVCLCVGVYTTYVRVFVCEDYVHVSVRLWRVVSGDQSGVFDVFKGFKFPSTSEWIGIMGLTPLVNSGRV